MAKNATVLTKEPQLRYYSDWSFVAATTCWTQLHLQHKQLHSALALLSQPSLTSLSTNNNHCEGETQYLVIKKFFNFEGKITHEPEVLTPTLNLILVTCN